MADKPESSSQPNVLSNDYVHWFRHASPYINSHRGKTFVVMLPGDCIAKGFQNIISDLSILQALGVKLVVVHGARKQIEDALSEKSLHTHFHHGARITTVDAMPSVIQAVGSVRVQLEASFTAGLPNSPMFGSKVSIRSGNFVTAMPQGIIDGIDYHYTGKVRSIEIQTIKDIIASNGIALLSPLGYSLTGEVFNVSFADVAVHAATLLDADKLIAYNDDGAICDDSGQQLRELTLLQCEKFLVKQQNNQSNTYFALRACHRACDGGVSRAHVISSSDDGALLKELYTRDGTGTMVYRDHYETIRRARENDIGGIINLIEPLEASGTLVKRSRELLENEIQYFTVMEKDNCIIGCAALYPMPDKKAAELACVAIDSEYRNDGRAAKLLTHIERQATKLKIEQLFALTTQTSHWFIEQGFIESTINSLPEEKQRLYNFQRQSKVFIKPLARN